MPDRPTITYRYSRLTFHRDSIEPLALTDQFRVETPFGAFQMSKRQFRESFPNVVNSRSYEIDGLYNYTKVPRKAEPFLVDSQPWASSSIRTRGRYYLPKALEGICSENAYKRWLHRKAQAHVIRDRKRWQIPLSVSDYKRAIHLAVIESGVHDAYTGEVMDWSLISKYNNDKSKTGGTKYKKKFAMLPTVDHAGDEPGDMNFRICSWRTNDSKSDLAFHDFLNLCRAVLAHHENQCSEQDSGGNR